MISKNLAACLALTLACPQVCSAAIVITEVNPTGSSNSTYVADWFELTNDGSAAVDITGWTFDDSSNAFASSVALTGLTQIAAGQSVVFVEGDATTTTNFITAWFGNNVPSDFAIGSYSGSGIGLSSGGDAVNIFNSAGTVIANVSFNAATLGVTFDNRAKINNGLVNALSVLNVGGAFNSLSGGELGSPGRIAAVPEPSGLIVCLGCLPLLVRRRRVPLGNCAQRG